MMNVNMISWFFLLIICFLGCTQQEEEGRDLDQMVQEESEAAQDVANHPQSETLQEESKQEILLREPM